MSLIPKALLANHDDLPFITLDTSLPFITEGSVELQLLQVDIEKGLWVVRTRFAPGSSIQTHKHTGEIFAFTSSGSWFYKEYPDDINLPGAYLYEPAGSVHTLHVPATNTEVTEICFVMNGANLNLNEQGEVESVLDAGVIWQVYSTTCDKLGYDIKGRVLGSSSNN